MTTGSSETVSRQMEQRKRLSLLLDLLVNRGFMAGILRSKSSDELWLIDDVDGCGFSLPASSSNLLMLPGLFDC